MDTGVNLAGILGPHRRIQKAWLGERWVWEGGVPLPPGNGPEERAYPSPEKEDLTFCLACFGESWPDQTRFAVYILQSYYVELQNDR